MNEAEGTPLPILIVIAILSLVAGLYVAGTLIAHMAITISLL